MMITLNGRHVGSAAWLPLALATIVVIMATEAAPEPSDQHYRAVHKLCEMLRKHRGAGGRIYLQERLDEYCVAKVQLFYFGSQVKINVYRIFSTEACIRAVYIV